MKKFSRLDIIKYKLHSERWDNNGFNVYNIYFDMSNTEFLSNGHTKKYNFYYKKYLDALQKVQFYNFLIKEY